MEKNDLVHIGDIVTLKPFKVINAYDGSFAAMPTVGNGAAVPILNEMIDSIKRDPRPLKVGNLMQRRGNQEMLKLLAHDEETDTWFVKQVTGVANSYALHHRVLQRDWHLVDTGAE